MDMWAVILLAIDLSLMGGALFIILRRSKAQKAVAENNGSSAVLESTPLIIELKNELAMAKALTAELRNKRNELEARQKNFAEKHKKFESVASQAEETARKIELLYLERKTDDSYSKAVKMLKTGKSSEEIVRSLGLPDGEVELLSSISNYRI